MIISLLSWSFFLNFFLVKSLSDFTENGNEYLSKCTKLHSITAPGIVIKNCHNMNNIIGALCIK